MNQLGIYLFLQIIIGGVFYSFQAFGYLPQSDPLQEELHFSSHNEYQNIRVIFFEQEENYLIPHCQISVEKYPQILSNQLEPSLLENPYITGNIQEFEANKEFKGESLFTNNSYIMTNLTLLDECEPQLSLNLVDFAKHFELYPQLAAGPFAPAIAGASVMTAGGVTTLSCALGGLLGFSGAYSLKVENQRARRKSFVENTGWEWLNYTPTNGEALLATGIIGGGAIAGTQVYAYLPIIQRNIRAFTLRMISAASGVVGAMCGVAGGVMGYFNAQPEISNEALY